MIISDRKLAGRRGSAGSIGQVFLGSLDRGLMRTDPETGEAGSATSARCARAGACLRLSSRRGHLDPARAESSRPSDGSVAFTELPETLAILEAGADGRSRGARAPRRRHARRRARAARERDRRPPELGAPVRSKLKRKQEEAIRAISAGMDLLAVLPTGYGKSYVFQLPGAGAARGDNRHQPACLADD